MINKKRNKNPLAQGLTDPSLPVPDINERFVDACENGDYPTVTRILESIKDFNIDVTDNLGRTALRLAVENEHLEVVQALLSRSDSAKMKEALLLAIYLGHTQIAESILRHPKYKVLNEKKFVNGDTDSFWQTPSSDDAQFSPDITPLMLAAQYNRTEIVQILLINGDRITKPHDFHCKCNECFNRFKFDSLRHAQSRLNAFRGLASESYISLASMDPILTSFELGHELRNLATKEKYFKNEYLQLADNLSIYVCRLLNNVRGRDELEIVLNKTGKETEEKYERLARLDLALKYEEKPFVAHSNCQQKLVEIWYTGLRKISKMNQLFTFLLLFVFLIMLPFNIGVYLIAPKSKLGRFMSQPCVKFMSHTISYLAFIIMIIVSSFQFSEEEKNFTEFYDYLPDNFTDEYETYMNYSDLTYHLSFPNYHFKIRHDKPTVMDILITIWIAGFLWQEFKQLYHYGAKDYLRSWNNIFNSLMNVIYVSSFSLKYYTMIVVRLTKIKVLDEKFWIMASSLNQTDYGAQKDVYNTLYWLNNDRYYWVSMDPINMAEGLFAIANLFSFIRVCFLLPANQQLGPLQISLGNMISDIMKFLSIFLIIFLAFMFALNNLFWYYQKSVRQPIELTDIQDDIQAEVNFGTILAAFGSMFWALFGLGDPNKVNLAPYQNQLTQVFGLLLYGAYHIASIIVLLNMLVASMTQSFERILHESDTEWKFSRSKLYMQYIRNDGTLPAPFNLIPSPKSIYYVFNLVVGLIKRNHPKPKPKANGEISNSHRPSRNMPEEINHKGGKQNKKPTSESEELTYIKVMQRIVKRFLLHKQRESDEVGEADFDELKQDLQMVRFEMLNDLKRSRDDTNRLISTMQAGLIIIGDEVFGGSKLNGENSLRFKEFKIAAASENDNNQGEMEKNGDEMPTSKSIELSASDSCPNFATRSNTENNLDNETNATLHKLVSFSPHVNTISATVDSNREHSGDTIKAIVDKTNSFTDLATVKIPLQDLDIIKEEDEIVEVKIHVNSKKPLIREVREKTEEDNSV